MKVRIANNKNIQTMEQKDIDIYEILKNEEYGTELYTPKCGRVWHSGMANDKDSAKAIWTEDEAGREHFFDKNGKIYKEGEILLFPSKEMRDWSKFFKKGDVLEYAGKDTQGTCIFVKYEDDTKMKFVGVYLKEKECLYYKRASSFRTADWVKSDDPAGYIRFVEERLGGKLNRETLEIEKTKPEFKDGDIVSLEIRYIDSEDVIVETYIVHGDYNNGENLNFYAGYRDNITDKVIYNSFERPDNTSVRKELLRYATEEEKKQIFSALEKEGKAWNSEKKQVVDLKPAFEIGKLYVFREEDEDEDGELTIIGKLIDKNESEGTLTFGYQYEIENEHFVTNETFYLNISLHKELREATELEAELFAKHRSIRLKEEKEAREQPDFKTFDKVLVRCGEKFKWLPAFFIRDRGEDFAFRYNVLPLHSGKTADFTHCIPFEGHENIAFTSYDIENLPF